MHSPQKKSSQSSHPAGRLRRWQAGALAMALVIAVVLCVSRPANALINPNFTPRELVAQSDQVIELKLEQLAENKLPAEVVRLLKGKTDVKTITLDLSKPRIPEHREAFEKALKDRGKDGGSVLFFIGKPQQDDGGDVDAKVPLQAYLHIDGVWVVFLSQEDGSWRMTDFNNTHLRETWQGGTDMLTRAVEYVQKDEDADFPSSDGAVWDDSKTFAKIDGTVHGCTPVDLVGDGRMALFVACANGDRLFRYEPADKSMKALVAPGSKSVCCTWGDFNADGRMDLASSDGTSVTVYNQNPEGGFTAGATLSGEAVAGTIHSLTLCALAGSSTPAVLVGAGTRLLAWLPASKDAPTVISDGALAKDLGAVGPLVVADLDGDGFPDIVECFENGSIWCYGKAVGSYQAAKPGKLSVGSAPSAAFTGDFDADGRLDLVTLSASAFRLWQNCGKAEFTESMFLSGEVGYKAAGNAVGGSTCDFNNDGRQDLFLFYSKGISPQPFFNRGFRSFGYGGHLGGDLTKTLPKEPVGQQAGCVADFTGDGGQDMAVVLQDGSAWFFPVVTGGGDALALRVNLPRKVAYAGPVTVTGYHENKCLGSWNVQGDGNEAFVAWKTAGPLTLKWRFPGEAEHSEEFTLEDKPLRVELHR